MAGYPSPPQGNAPQGGPPGSPPPGYGAAGYPPPGYGAPQGGRPKSGMPTWLIVVLVCGVLFVFGGGILASLAIYGVRKYISAAKSAEALNSLARMGTGAVTAFERGATTKRGELVHRICPSASASVPAAILSVKGMKYQSAPSEWQVDADRNAGFACLGFSMATPQYFLYRYTAHGGTKPDDSFVAEAQADFAGDGNVTTLRSTGKIMATGTLEVTPPPRPGE